MANLNNTLIHAIAHDNIEQVSELLNSGSLKTYAKHMFLGGFYILRI
jgi:hypothetical protein